MTSVARLRDGIQAAGSSDPASVRFLVSAHAATEELFVLKDIVTGLLGSDGVNAVTVAWKVSPKPQPAGAKFIVPSTDAPNVNGARDVGFAVGQGNGHEADTSALRTAIDAGRVKALYVVDPGPDGSLGDVHGSCRPEEWLSARCSSCRVSSCRNLPRQRTRAPRSGLGREGRDLYERSGEGARGIASNRAARGGHGGLGDSGPRGPSPGSVPPLPDCQRRAQGDLERVPAAYADADKVPFTRPVPARNWLQASNPSERWKWDFLYQDLPPVKGHNVQMEAVSSYIPLKPVG